MELQAKTKPQIEIYNAAIRYHNRPIHNTILDDFVKNR